MPQFLLIKNFIFYTKWCKLKWLFPCKQTENALNCLSISCYHYEDHFSIFMLLSSLPKSTCIVLCHFRFQKQDMDRLLEALQIPDSNTSYQGSVFTGMQSLMILLRRLSYPNRWCDLVPIFGRTEPEQKQRRCITHKTILISN